MRGAAHVLGFLRGLALDVHHGIDEAIEHILALGLGRLHQHRAMDDSRHGPK